MDLQTGLYVALASASGLILAGLGYLVKKITDKMKADTKHALVMSSLARITDAAFGVVKAVGQVMADDVKKKAADGKLSDQEKAEIRNTALSTLKTALGEQFMASAQGALQLGQDGLNELLGVKLESALHDVKAQAASASQVK